MTSPKTLWLRLELKPGQNLSEQAIKIHTFFAMHEHLCEQGHELAFYQHDASGDPSRQMIAFLKTDHPGFYQRSQESLARGFSLSELNPHFVLPRGYQLVYGAEKRVAKAV